MSDSVGKRVAERLRTLDKVRAEREEDTRCSHCREYSAPPAEVEVQRLRALLAELPDRIKAECEAEAKKHNHPEEFDYRAGVRWGGQVGYNVAKEAMHE